MLEPLERRVLMSADFGPAAEIPVADVLAAYTAQADPGLAETGQGESVGDVLAQLESLAGDTAVAGFTGAATCTDNGQTFSIAVAGGGTIDWSYDAGSDTLTVTDVSPAAGPAIAFDVYGFHGFNRHLWTVGLDSPWCRAVSQEGSTVEYHVEDQGFKGGGDRDFNDLVFSVTYDDYGRAQAVTYMGGSHGYHFNMLADGEVVMHDVDRHVGETVTFDLADPAETMALAVVDHTGGLTADRVSVDCDMAALIVDAEVGTIQVDGAFGGDVVVAGDLDRFEAGAGFTGTLSVGGARGHFELNVAGARRAHAFRHRHAVTFDGATGDLAVSSRRPAADDGQVGTGRPTDPALARQFRTVAGPARRLAGAVIARPAHGRATFSTDRASARARISNSHSETRFKNAQDEGGDDLAARRLHVGLNENVAEIVETAQSNAGQPKREGGSAPDGAMPAHILANDNPAAETDDAVSAGSVRAESIPTLTDAKVQSSEANPAGGAGHPGGPDSDAVGASPHTAVFSGDRLDGDVLANAAPMALHLQRPTAELTEGGPRTTSREGSWQGAGITAQSDLLDEGGARPRTHVDRRSVRTGHVVHRRAYPLRRRGQGGVAAEPGGVPGRQPGRASAEHRPPVG